MNSQTRPISPHLQVYKPPITSVLSILHRITGVGLAVGALALVYWLNSAAYGPEAFARTQEFMATWFGRLLLFGWTWALFYHLCNGIRHLFWDAGMGFGLTNVNITGWIVVFSSIIFTFGSWFLGYGMVGG